MIRTADGTWTEIIRQAWDDLQPYPGRAGLTWRVALLCAVVAGTAMLFKIPEAAISCYLVIFLSKQDAVQNSLMAFGVILLATAVVWLMIPLINATIGSPPLRLAIMFFVTYVFLFLSSATPLGEQAAIVALIVAFIMTLVQKVPIGEIGSEGLLMAWKMACMPMFLMILMNLLFGVPAQRHVRGSIVRRLRCTAEHIRAGENDRDVVELLGEGNDLSLQQMLLVKLLHLVPKAESTWLNGGVETSYRILLAGLTLDKDCPEDTRQAFATAIEKAADRIEAREQPEMPSGLPAVSDPVQAELVASLAGLAAADGGGQPRPRAQPLLAPDAFTNPDHQRYALQTSVAAVLCYLIYTGIQWDGIHTAMITCYVAALGTTGETVRKLTLRIVGCLIGAAIGVLSLILVMPYLTSVGGLMALVFIGLLAGAWVAAGNERIYYAGVQIALAFLLTTLNGFGPSFEFSQATNRIYGILLGLGVIYVIFTQFWSRTVLTSARKRIIEAIDALEAMNAMPGDDRRARVESATAAQIALTQAEEMLDMAPFEPARMRATPERIRQFRSMVDDLRLLAREMYFASPGAEPQAGRLQEVRAGLEPDGALVETPPTERLASVSGAPT